MGRENLRLISCHLGGSNSLCAIRDGKSVASSLGMSPQTGLPHNNRVGDFDPFALPVLIEKTGKSLGELLEEMGSRGGLLGLSGISGDIRDLEQAADRGISVPAGLGCSPRRSAIISAPISSSWGRRRHRLDRRHWREQRPRSGGRFPQSGRTGHRAR